MKYLMLLTNPKENVESWERLGPDEAQKLREAELPKWGAFMQWAAERGVQLEGLELDSPRTAKTVREAGGGAVVTDGPFPETKEVIGGYFLAECEDLDHAIDVASRIPVAETGSVEIRPLVGEN
jgi:hypothetical protein